mmetsp:Transcript_11772/g.40637  ORF Transcript_11772/g.40637 Transcript_11772/m.40637 type:complete len:508 (+) Transcript_11772:111-1634(+)
MQALFLRHEWVQARHHLTQLCRFKCLRSAQISVPSVHHRVMQFSFANNRRFSSTPTEGNGNDYSKGRYTLWPWIFAVASGSLTIYVINSIEDENLYKRIVKELRASSGLKALRALFVFAGRRPDEVREKLARNGCVEALVNLQVRTSNDLQDYVSKLENLYALSISSGQIDNFRDQFVSAFNNREFSSQMLAVVMDCDRGRERFFASERYMDVINSLISDESEYDWAALALEYRQNRSEGKPSRAPSHFARGQTFGSYAADDEQTDMNDAVVRETTKARNWTPSEAMLVASIATDPRGQEILCKSTAAQKLMLDILSRDEIIPRTRQEILEFQNHNIRRLAIIRAIGGIAKLRSEESTNFLNSPELTKSLVDLYHRKKDSDPLAARLIVDVSREIANAIPSLSYDATFEPILSETRFHSKITSQDISWDFPRVMLNALWAGVCGSLWGTLRHYRIIRQKTVIPLPGTLQRAAQASIPAAVGSMGLSVVASGIQVYLIRELFQEKSTM